MELGARPEGRAYTLGRTFVFGNPPPLHPLRRAEGRSPGGAWSRGGGRSGPPGTATRTAGAALPRPARPDAMITDTDRATDTDRVTDRVTVRDTGGRVGVARVGGWVSHLARRAGRASHLPSSSFVSRLTFHVSRTGGRAGATAARVRTEARTGGPPRAGRGWVERSRPGPSLARVGRRARPSPRAERGGVPRDARTGRSRAAEGPEATTGSRGAGAFHDLRPGEEGPRRTTSW